VSDQLTAWDVLSRILAPADERWVFRDPVVVKFNGRIRFIVRYRRRRSGPRPLCVDGHEYRRRKRARRRR
jgi:hypothetical protein